MLQWLIQEGEILQVSDPLLYFGEEVTFHAYSFLVIF